jgi:catalase
VAYSYFNNNQEGMAHLMRLFSDAATPISLRNTNIWSANTYKFTKTDGTFSYIKLHLVTNQGIKNFNNDQAVAMTAQNPDFYTEDLFNAIDSGDFPSWDVKAQIITPDQAEKYPINIFDVTKTLPKTDFPLISFGKITLNRNPDDFFTEVEQAAFSPTSIVPGWEPSPDPGK